MEKVTNDSGGASCQFSELPIVLGRIGVMKEKGSGFSERQSLEWAICYS